jgi:hypothetical protein
MRKQEMITEKILTQLIITEREISIISKEKMKRNYKEEF